VAALIIAPLSLITFLADGFRLESRSAAAPPARPAAGDPVLAIWIAVAPWLFHLHTVRITETVRSASALEKLFQQWAAPAAGHGAGAAIIVAISGGASRAGVVGRAGAARAEESRRSRSGLVFAVSSVSGGSLRLGGAYMAPWARHAGRALRQRRPDDKRKQRSAQLLAQPTARPRRAGALLAGALAVDIPRNLPSPFAAVGPHLRPVASRAAAIAPRRSKRAFEELWGPIGDDRLPFGAPYLMLFYKDFAPQGQPPAGSYRAACHCGSPTAPTPAPAGGW